MGDNIPSAGGQPVGSIAIGTWLPPRHSPPRDWRPFRPHERPLSSLPLTHTLSVLLSLPLPSLSPRHRLISLHSDRQLSLTAVRGSVPAPLLARAYRQRYETLLTTSTAPSQCCPVDAVACGVAGKGYEAPFDRELPLVPLWIVGDWPFPSSAIGRPAPVPLCLGSFRRNHTTGKFHLHLPPAQKIFRHDPPSPPDLLSDLRFFFSFSTSHPVQPNRTHFPACEVTTIGAGPIQRPRAPPAKCNRSFAPKIPVCLAVYIRSDSRPSGSPAQEQKSSRNSPSYPRFMPSLCAIKSPKYLCFSPSSHHPRSCSRNHAALTDAIQVR